MKNQVNEKQVTGHVFEYTTSFALDSDLRFKYPDKGIVPTQIIFCMKEKNQKKINSHRWGFNAFGAMLQVSRGWFPGLITIMLIFCVIAECLCTAGCWDTSREQ